MNGNNGTTPERYRSLALSHLYLEARRRSTSIGRLPPDMLSKVGVRAYKDGNNVTLFEVTPPKLDTPEAQELVARLERECKENAAVFQRQKETKPKTRNRKPVTGGWKPKTAAGRGRPRNEFPDVAILEEGLALQEPKDKF
ncbi:MAG: hypothetical protein AB1529_02065 [Candidatus Micrarchaeota archaeon]